MTSSRLPPAVELHLAPSRLLWRYLLIIHLLALLGIWLAALPLWLRFGLTAAVAGSLGWRWLHRTRSETTGLRWQAGEWQLLRGAEAEVAACRGYTAWPMLVALDLRIGRRRRPVLVMADSVAPEQFRRLRVLLFSGV